MATIKSYTDIEQSKKLAEILPLESADFCYIKTGVTSDNWMGVPEYQFKPISHKDYNGESIGCWSLAALMNLLPSEFTTENKFGKYKYEINIRKYKLTDNVDIYQIAYGNYKWYEDGSHSWKDMINTGEKESLIDCCVQMIIKLKEMNLI